MRKFVREKFVYVNEPLAGALVVSGSQRTGTDKFVAASMTLLRPGTPTNVKTTPAFPDKKRFVIVGGGRFSTVTLVNA